MPHAARKGDPIGHSPAMSWLVQGLLLGAAVGVGAALVIGTGGLAAAAIVGCLAAGGAGIGELLSSMSWAPKEVCGMIITGSPDILINNRPAARAHVDTTICSKHSGTPPIATGSATVIFNNMPAARVDDTITCGAVIVEGSPDVIIGGGTVQTDTVNPENLVPAWVHWSLLAVGIGAAVILGGPIVAALGLVGGIGGGMGCGWLGGRIFGQGSDGQKWMMLGGSVVGGMAGAKGGVWFNKNYTVSTQGLGSNAGNVKILPKEPVTVRLSSSKYPETCQHIRDAQAAGHPKELTIDRMGAKTNRSESLKGYDKVPGKQLDEYPPAMFKEGGKGASVRAVDGADNMGAGAAMGNKLRKLPDNTKIIIEVGN